MKAKAPSRSSGKLTIAFGLMSVPVNVYSGLDEDAGKIKREMRSPKGNPVGFPVQDKVTGEAITRSDTTLVYVTDDGVEVPLTDDEIASALNEENGSCEIVGFFPLSEKDAYVVQGVMQVRPQTVKSGKTTTHPFIKPFALLMGAMKMSGTFALLRYTMRGKPHLGVLTSDGTMSVVAFENEVKDTLPMPEADVSSAEIGMAKALVEAMTFDEAPQMQSPLEKVREYAEAKAAGVVKAPEEDKAPEATTDYMAALEASIALAKAHKVAAA
jgi:DNA end-binding protein Ku